MIIGTSETSCSGHAVAELQLTKNRNLQRLRGGWGGWGGDNFIGRPEFESRRVDIDAASLEELKDQQPGEPACMTSATK